MCDAKIELKKLNMLMFTEMFTNIVILRELSGDEISVTNINQEYFIFQDYFICHFSIWSRIGKAQGIFRKLNEIWTRESVDLKTKLLIFKSVVLQTVTYANKTWIKTPKEPKMCKLPSHIEEGLLPDQLRLKYCREWRTGSHFPLCTEQSSIVEQYVTILMLVKFYNYIF